MAAALMLGSCATLGIALYVAAGILSDVSEWRNQIPDVDQWYGRMLMIQYTIAFLGPALWYAVHHVIGLGKDIFHTRYHLFLFYFEVYMVNIFIMYVVSEASMLAGDKTVTISGRLEVSGSFLSWDRREGAESDPLNPSYAREPRFLVTRAGEFTQSVDIKTSYLNLNSWREGIGILTVPVMEKYLLKDADDKNKDAKENQKLEASDLSIESEHGFSVRSNIFFDTDSGFLEVEQSFLKLVALSRQIDDIGFAPWFYVKGGNGQNIELAGKVLGQQEAWRSYPQLGDTENMRVFPTAPFQYRPTDGTGVLTIFLKSELGDGPSPLIPFSFSNIRQPGLLVTARSVEDLVIKLPVSHAGAYKFRVGKAEIFNNSQSLSQEDVIEVDFGARSYGKIEFTFPDCNVIIIGKPVSVMINGEEMIPSRLDTWSSFYQGVFWFIFGAFASSLAGRLANILLSGRPRSITQS
jgi:hypothetical protein